MTEQNPPKSESKAQVESLLEGFQASFDDGDYWQARVIAQELDGLAPEHSSVPEVRERAALLAMDPLVVRFGFGVIGLYLIGWAVAKFTVS